MSLENKCETPGCAKAATLQCPTCLKLGIQGSFFCDQECFKGYWKGHKIIHALASMYEYNYDSMKDDVMIVIDFILQRAVARAATALLTSTNHGRRTVSAANCVHIHRHQFAKCRRPSRVPIMPIIHRDGRPARKVSEVSFFF